MPQCTTTSNTSTSSTVVSTKQAIPSLFHQSKSASPSARARACVCVCVCVCVCSIMAMHPVGMGRYDAPAMYILRRSLCSSSEANHESCSSDALLHAQQRKCKESDTLLYTASRAACRGLASAGHVRRRALLNRQRTGRGAYVDSSPFYDHEAAEGALSCLLSSASCSSLLSSSRTFGCSRPVLLANSIVALTASMSAFHRSIGPSMLCPLSCLLEYPPNAYDSSPNRCPCCCCRLAG